VGEGRWWGRNEESVAIAVDSANNAYVTGPFNSQTATFGNITLTNSTSYDENFFVVKYDTDGNVVWAKAFGGVGSADSTGIAIDAIGNLYVTGTFYSTNITFGSVVLTNLGLSSYDIFLAKLDNTGNVLWAQSAGGGDDSDFARSLGLDPAGNVLLGGTFLSTLANVRNFDPDNPYPHQSRIFMAKYDTSGNVQWVKSAGGNGYNNLNGLRYDTSGNFCITGDYSSPTAVFDGVIITNAYSPYSQIFLTKYDNVGNAVWARSAGGTSYDTASSVCC